jgi:hypothetical protein
MARFAYLVKRDPKLQRDFGAVADRYIRAVQETVQAFDHAWREGPGSSEGHYHGVYTAATLPLNMQNTLGRTLVTLWLITNKSEYKEKAEKLANFFKNQVKQVDNRYVWPYMPYSDSAEDISHASINVDFAFICYRAQIGFTRDDLLQFAQTLKFCTRGSEGYTKTVDGRGDLAYSAQMGRWAHLAYLDYDIRENLYKYFKDNWENNTIAGMLTSAYLTETQNKLVFESPLTANKTNDK